MHSAIAVSYTHLIAEGRQLLLLNLCFGVAHDVAQLIDFLADAEGKCLACLACTPCTPNAVYIIFLILRYIIEMCIRDSLRYCFSGRRAVR